MLRRLLLLHCIVISAMFCGCLNLHPPTVLGQQTELGDDIGVGTGTGIGTGVGTVQAQA